MAFRPKDTQERIIHRLKITKGHLEKVIDMVSKNEYCIDILHQLNAVERALKETQGVVLENHLKTCAIDSIKKGKTDEAIAEIMNVFQKKMDKFLVSFFGIVAIGFTYWLFLSKR